MRAKRAVQSKRTSERCERRSERTSEWPSTNVKILGYSVLLCSDIVDVPLLRVHLRPGLSLRGAESVVLALRGGFVARPLPRSHSTNLRLPRRLRRLPLGLPRHRTLRHMQVRVTGGIVIMILMVTFSVTIFSLIIFKCDYASLQEVMSERP